MDRSLLDNATLLDQAQSEAKANDCEEKAQPLKDDSDKRRIDKDTDSQPHITSLDKDSSQPTQNPSSIRLGVASRLCNTDSIKQPTQNKHITSPLKDDVVSFGDSVCGKEVMKDKDSASRRPQGSCSKASVSEIGGRLRGTKLSEEDNERVFKASVKQRSFKDELVRGDDELIRKDELER